MQVRWPEVRKRSRGESMVHCMKFLSGYLIQGVSIDFSTPYIIYIIFNYPISEHGLSESLCFCLRAVLQGGQNGSTQAPIQQGREELTTLSISHPMKASSQSLLISRLTLWLLPKVMPLRILYGPSYVRPKCPNQIHCNQDVVGEKSTNCWSRLSTLYRVVGLSIFCSGNLLGIECICIDLAWEPRLGSRSRRVSSPKYAYP